MRKPNAKRIVRPAPKKRRDAYKSYNFIDKDPIIHEVWDIVKGTSFQYIEDESGVSVSCLMAWFYGNTKRPQAATVRAVIRSVGYDFKIVRTDKDAETRAEPGAHAIPIKLPSATVVPFRLKRR